MVAIAAHDVARQAVQIDDDRILWDAEYRREVILRLKRLDQAREQAKSAARAPVEPSRAA